MSKAKTTKQFTNATFESKANRLLCANLRFKFNANYLLIRFWVIDFICLLNSRDLDCFALPLARTRNDEVGRFVECFGKSTILPAMTIISRDSHSTKIQSKSATPTQKSRLILCK